MRQRISRDRVKFNALEKSQNDVRAIINEEEELVKIFLESATTKGEHYSSCLLKLKKYVRRRRVALP